MECVSVRQPNVSTGDTAGTLLLWLVATLLGRYASQREDDCQYAMQYLDIESSQQNMALKAGGMGCGSRT